jgi:prepilin-type N-terminal cleavage/methylation domain-containing protein
MRNRNYRHHAPGRAGFTMIEVLLVLALLVVVTALAWPMLQRPFANRRLYAAADLVRAGWCNARSGAIRSGHTYAFRYLPEGDRFCVQPEDDSGAGGMSDASGSGVDGTPMPSDDEYSQPVERTLPDGVKFVAGDTSTDAMADAGADMPPDGDASWSEPILFYPDGTTSDAHLMLGNESGSAMEVTLRGLTGAVTTGEVVAGGE